MNCRAGERSLFLCDQLTEPASPVSKDMMKVVKGRLGVGEGDGKKIDNK
jgi:hypothetical protein